jgi:integrase
VLTILKAALNQAWHDGKVSNDEAWRRVKPFRDADKAKVRYLGADECRRLVNACDADFRGLVQAALLTGCRYGELTAMQVGDFTRESESVHVRTSKSGKPRHVPLNAEGNTFFTRLVTGRASADRMFVRADGKPWGVSHQRRRLESAAKRASIEDVTFHILRHCYGSALAMNGIPMGVIAAALGHSDTRITEKHYAALAPSYVGYMIRAHLPNLGMVQEDKNVVSLRLND